MDRETKRAIEDFRRNEAGPIENNLIDELMASATHSPAHLVSTEKALPDESGLFSSESVLDILRMILAGAPLAEVLAEGERILDGTD